MSALRYFSTAKPSQIGMKLEPMSAEDERFWELLRARRTRDGIEARRVETRSGSIHESPVPKARALKGSL